jgi:hypothetical protein
MVRAARRVVGWWVVFSLAGAAYADEHHCREVHARGTGQDLGGGVTHADIRGSRLLRGTTDALFSIVSVQGSVAMLVGTVNFTVRDGTLAVGVIGTFDLASGAFRALSTSLSGTGRLAGVSGNLVFEGVENFSTGAFTEEISGDLCRDRDDGDDAESLRP